MAHGSCLRLVNRSKSSRQTSLSLCFLVFTMTGAIVYWRGVQNWVPPSLLPTYTATVALFEQAASAAGEPTTVSPPDKHNRFTFTQTERTAEQAIQFVKTQAVHYADRQREEWNARHAAPYGKAKEAAEDARRAHAKATAELAAYCRQTDAARQTAVRARERTLRPSVEPRMVDNPRWQELKSQLAALQKEDAELRAYRTSLHPAVQDVAARIAGVEKQLASTPERIPADDTEAGAVATSQKAAQEPTPTVKSGVQGSAANTPLSLSPARDNVVGEPTNVPTAAPSTSSEPSRWVELVAAVDRTRIACEEADAAEKAALAARQASPAFILDEVQVVENVPPVDYGWRRLVITTLGTSVMMAVGFGAFTKGAEIDPTLANAAQLAADANVPILGVVPAADPIDATGKFNRQSRSRKALIALGFFLMCVSPFAAIWGVMGM